MDVKSVTATERYDLFSEEIIGIENNNFPNRNLLVLFPSFCYFRDQYQTNVTRRLVLVVAYSDLRE